MSHIQVSKQRLLNNEVPQQFLLLSGGDTGDGRTGMHGKLQYGQDSSPEMLVELSIHFVSHVCVGLLCSASFFV